MSINISNLYVGQVIKNYPALCKLIDQPYIKKRNNHFQAQDKIFRKYFSYERGKGQSLIITSVASPEEALLIDEEIEAEKKSSIKCADHIRALLYNLIGPYNPGKEVYLEPYLFTKTSLWQNLGMLTQFYNDWKKDSVTKSLFHTHVIRAINWILTYNLDSFAHNGWISCDKVYGISERKGYALREATVDETKKLNAAYASVMKKYNITSMQQAVFYRRERDIMKEVTDITGFYHRRMIHIVLLKEPEIKSDIPLEERRTLLGDYLLSRVDKIIEREYNRVMQRAEEMYEAEHIVIGKKEEMMKHFGIYTLPDDFCENMKDLARKCIVHSESSDSVDDIMNMNEARNTDVKNEVIIQDNVA